MNDESPTPPDSGPDASVEARIVAWVLGEASAFEAAELERLCKERPELLVFRRRMRDLHGLLTDAESAEADLSWRLPAEKRRVLDEIFGGQMAAPVVAPAPPSNEPAIRRNGLRVVFAIAACVAISFSVVQLMPSGHEAEVVLEFKAQGMGMAPQSFASEFDRIKSPESLSRVVEKLDLASRWNMDEDAAVQRLRDSTVTENTRGTDLLSIKVRDANESDAKEIVREIARNYRDYRWEQAARDSENGLAELNKAVRDQEAKVEENRRLLATISKNKGIIYRGTDPYHGEGRVDEDRVGTREEAITRGLAGQDYVDAKRELEVSQALLDSMKLKKIGAETALKMTQESIVIHDEPGVVGIDQPASVAFQVPAPSLAKNTESNMMRDARQQQLAKQSASPRSRVMASSRVPTRSSSTLPSP
jgi:GH25 family lysozyme M1 (1,4-beta-N-acetylmuramidase)